MYVEGNTGPGSSPRNRRVGTTITKPRTQEPKRGRRTAIEKLAPSKKTGGKVMAVHEKKKGRVSKRGKREKNRYARQPDCPNKAFQKGPRGGVRLNCKAKKILQMRRGKNIEEARKTLKGKLIKKRLTPGGWNPERNLFGNTEKEKNGLIRKRTRLSELGLRRMKGVGPAPEEDSLSGDTVVGGRGGGPKEGGIRFCGTLDARSPRIDRDTLLRSTTNPKKIKKKGHLGGRVDGYPVGTGRRRGPQIKLGRVTRRMGGLQPLTRRQKNQKRKKARIVRSAHPREEGGAFP